VPVNPDLAGRTFPPTAPYLVGREKVREFARAVFSESPLSLDVAAARAAGYPDLVAPPTFAVVIQQASLDGLLADPDAGFAIEQVVHGEQRFAYTRPIVAGDELRGTLSVTSLRSAGGHSMLTADTVITDADGETVVVATSTLVVRGEE